MTLITFQDGKPVMRDGKVGTGQGCCCGGGGCGRCVVAPYGYVEPRWHTQAECERCRLCVESLSTECDGDCPPGTVAKPPLVTLEFSSTKCGTGGTGSVEIGCGTILSATVTDGGSGYATETIAKPTLTLTAPGGTGGALTVSGYSKYTDSDNAGYWGIAGVTVTSGGSGYTDNAQVSVTLGTGDEARPNGVEPDIRIRTVIDPPADEWTLDAYDESWNPSAGSGLALSFTLTRLQSSNRWGISSASVTNGGSGYSVGDFVDAYLASSLWAAGLDITSVDQNGAVTGLFLSYGGEHEGSDTGVIESVEFANGPFGTPPSHGAYRKLTAETCEVAVSVVQESPSNGTGATIMATVETAAGENFGKVKSLTVTNGGSGYASLCERKTTVATCDECPSRESPESSTCDDTGGCPCGTWVVDDNQQPCSCCKWTNPEWGIVLLNLVDGNGDSLPYTDMEVECSKLRDKLRLIRGYFEQAGWTVTLDENWCPSNVSSIWDVTPTNPPTGQYSFTDPENPCGCGFLFRAECESCSRAYPARIWTSGFDIFAGQLEARPFDLNQWVAMPIEDWQHTVHNEFPVTDHVVWPTAYGGFARTVYCQQVIDGQVAYKDPSGGYLPVFNFVKRPGIIPNSLIYGDFLTGSFDGPLYRGGGLIPGYYSKGEKTTWNGNSNSQQGGFIYIPKCGVEITERARCIRYAGDPIIGTVQVLDDTWATCCAECPPGYRCFFAADPLDSTIINSNPLP